MDVAQGAFRSGNYKYLAKEACSGWFTFDGHTNAEDPLTNITAQCGGLACADCGQSCASHNTSDYLFDLAADPREENNLIFEYPDVSSPCCVLSYLSLILSQFAVLTRTRTRAVHWRDRSAGVC